MKEDFNFNQAQLLELAKGRRDEYRKAVPFPHVVFDGLLPNWVLGKVLEEIPAQNESSWKVFRELNQNKKLSCEDESKLGPATRHVISQFNSSTFLSFLEALTGVDGLIADPHLRGGGFHQTCYGGSLAVHADFNYYGRLKVYRRINLIVYLNVDWLESYGGHLELWDAGMEICCQKILPVFNRTVVFDSNDVSYHGHPEPLRCPMDRTRKSLAIYYYTVDSPSGAPEAAHSTIFRRRPGTR